jgi:hypothetical protein
MGARFCWWHSTLLVAVLAGPIQAAAGKPSVAFFYGKPVLLPELSHFDWVVVQPEHLEAKELAELQAGGVQVFAYLSVGEAAAGTPVEPGWTLGSNRAWDSAIMNPAAAGWRERVLQRADALWNSGYRGLFLDTLDSYLAALPGAEARRAAATALATLIRAIHGRHPDLKLFFNRGFELLDDVGTLAAGLAAESLLFGWDASTKRYIDVPEADRKWLAAQLQKVKDRFGIPVVVVDYLPPTRRAAARDAARKIQGMGFTPWISTPALDVLGVGSVEVILRRVLLLYDGAEAPTLEQSPVLRLAGLPIEHLGYVPIYLDVRTGLPQEPLEGRYAGIVTWFTDDEMPDTLGYPEWLLRQIEAGIPVAILGRPGFSASRTLLARLGLAAGATPPSQPLRIVQQDALVGLESDARRRSRGLLAWRVTDPDVTSHLRLADAQGEPIDPIVTAPWGGMALDPYVLDIGYQGRTRWILDPFAFLEKALALRPAPALDLTTENGARLLVVVADGDGIARPAGRSAAHAGDVILREVLARLAVPTTVYIRPDQLEAAENDRARSHLGGVARAIFALPNVEPAEQGVRLASGNAQDAGEASLAQLSPSGYPTGHGFRVYLPGWNESGAASWWSAGVFDPERLVELFERAETPRRLKPIGIYYPFWVATRPAALRSVQEVLRWAQDRAVLPLWSTEYAQRVVDFRSASVARRLDGTWQFRRLGRLRTVRMPRALGWPDLARSRGVASISELGESRYVSFAPEESPTLALSEEPTRGTYLSWANAPLARWSAQGRTVSLRLRGHEPVRFSVEGSPDGCTLTANGRKIRPARAGAHATFSLAHADTGDARLECGRN